MSMIIKLLTACCDSSQNQQIQNHQLHFNSSETASFHSWKLLLGFYFYEGKMERKEFVNLIIKHVLIIICFPFFKRILLVYRQKDFPPAADLMMSWTSSFQQFWYLQETLSHVRLQVTFTYVRTETVIDRETLWCDSETDECVSACFTQRPDHEDNVGYYNMNIMSLKQYLHDLLKWKQSCYSLVWFPVS